MIGHRLERAPRLVFLLQLRAFIVRLERLPLPKAELRVEEAEAERRVCVSASDCWVLQLLSDSRSPLNVHVGLLLNGEDRGRLFIG